MMTFVLVHGPLVGPATLQPLAAALARHGVHAVVPPLGPAAASPFWPQHVAPVAHRLRAVAPRAAMLVGHSGGGPLLPAIGAAAPGAVGAYLFVDADIPRNGVSRLDLFASAEDRAAFRAAAIDGMLPPWTDDDLRAAIPDPALRRRVVAELAPLPIEVYEEPLPVPADWPDAPCAYLHLSPPYAHMAAAAREAGWPVASLPGSHFQPTTEPDGVADALVALVQAMGLSVP